MGWILVAILFLWQVIKWIFKWIIVLPFVMSLLFVVGLLGTLLPIGGSVLHGLAIIYSSIHIVIPLLEGHGSIWQVVILVALLLAIIDCVNDVLFTIKYGKAEKDGSPFKLWEDVFYTLVGDYGLEKGIKKLRGELKEEFLKDSYRVMRAIVSGAAIALGSAWFYFSASGGSIGNILANIDVLLILLVIPRAGFVISDKIAGTVIYPKVLDLIKKEAFFPHKESLYYSRYIYILQHKGLVVTNTKTIAKEKGASKRKVDSLYPKTTIEKLAEKLSSDKSLINKRNNAEADLEKNRKACCISPSGYARFCTEMEQTLMGSGTFSPRTFIEKKFPAESERLLSIGADYFLIQAFEDARKEGRITDLNISDDPLVNHAYRHVQSKVQPKVINADEDPRLALDD